MSQLSQQSIVNESLFRAHNVAEKRQIIDGFIALYDNERAGELNLSTNSSSSDVAKHHSNRRSTVSQDEPEELFSETIEFRDPLMHVSGLHNYKLNFAALHSGVRRTQLDILSITTGTGMPWTGCYTSKSNSEDSVKEETEIITIEAMATYQINRFVSIKLRQVSRLGLNNDGMIQTHEDLWSFADLIESIPIVGRLYRWGQFKVGQVFCWLINKRYAHAAGVPMREAQLNTNTLHAVYHPVESQRYGKHIDNANRLASKYHRSGEDASGEEEEEREAESSATAPINGNSKKSNVKFSGTVHHRGEHKSGGKKDHHRMSNGGEEKQQRQQNRVM